MLEVGNQIFQASQSIEKNEHWQANHFKNLDGHGHNRNNSK